MDIETVRPLLERLIQLLADDDLDAEEVLDDLVGHLSGPARGMAEDIGRLKAAYDFEGALAKARELSEYMGFADGSDK